MCDLILFVFGFLIFIVIRHLSLSYGDPLLGTKKINYSLWRQFINYAFNRYSDHKYEDDNTYLGFIFSTIKTSDTEIIEKCGIDGYLYLRYQKCLILMLFIETLIIFPILSIKIELEIIQIITITISTFLVTYFTIKSTNNDSINGQSLTIKISNLSSNTNEQELIDCFDGVDKIYICKNIGKLIKLEKQLECVEAKKNYYEYKLSASNKDIFIYSSRFLREINCVLKYCFPCLNIKKTLNANIYYQNKSDIIKKKINEMKNSLTNVGVAFVTFANVNHFLTSLKRTTLDPLIIEQAPHSDDIEWDNLHISKDYHIIRIIIINLLIFIVLFFFTTPMAIFSITNLFSANLFKSTIIGNLIESFISSFFVVFLMFIIPHIIFFTTEFEGYQTKSYKNAAGLYKVYFYQLFALLILPILSSISLKSLFSLHFHQLIDIFRSERLFSNEIFFVKIVLQATFLANICDLWRGYELIMQYVRKLRATTLNELREAEVVPPFIFGFEYQYFIVIFTITIFYSTTVPIIIPCGLLYLSIKHFVDKYNLLYHYPKSPDNINILTKSALITTIIGMAMYQMLMIFHFHYNERENAKTITTCICMVLMITLCLFLCFTNLYSGKSQTDNVYVHPYFKNKAIISNKIKMEYNTMT